MTESTTLQQLPFQRRRVARRGERDRGRPRRVRDQRQGVAEGGRRPGSARVGLPVASCHRLQGENGELRLRHFISDSVRNAVSLFRMIEPAKSSTSAVELSYRAATY